MAFEQPRYHRGRPKGSRRTPKNERKRPEKGLGKDSTKTFKKIVALIPTELNNHQR
jgi:hypothetical protein